MVPQIVEEMLLITKILPVMKNTSLEKPYLIKTVMVLLFILCPVNSAVSQEIAVKIKIPSATETKAQIEGKIISETDGTPSKGRKNWSYLQLYADVQGLGGRIKSFEIPNDNSNTVKRLISGEYETLRPSGNWKSEFVLDIPPEITASAHISWLSQDRGLLMMADLLPQFGKNVKGTFEFELPEGWRILSTDLQIGNNKFTSNNPEKSVFLVGNDWREKKGWLGKHELRLAIAGGWTFTDEETVSMANEILEEHRKTFGEMPNNKTLLILMPFSQTVNFDRWRAETRGSTVVILSGMIPYKSMAINRLHEQLRHELFHLWVPNGLNLTGNYDWFYEGFTIYQALRVGVKLGYIRFEDYLDTLGRAFDIVQIKSSVSNVSLIEASKRRWSGATSVVYSKGLIVAFLCDVALMRESGGKRNLNEIFRELFEENKNLSATQEGNTVILNLLKSHLELKPIAVNIIEQPSQIDWTEELKYLGLKSEKDKFGTKLVIIEKPNGRQRDLLAKLGYNQNPRFVIQQVQPKKS
jgi:hypothetical protein